MKRKHVVSKVKSGSIKQRVKERLRIKRDREGSAYVYEERKKAT